jgi:hypothetical protein
VPTTQTNIQINDLSNHQRLLERLLQNKLWSTTLTTFKRQLAT